MKKKKIVLFLAGAMLLSGINCLNSFSITGSDIVVQAAEISENIFEDGEYSYTLNEDGTAIINKCLSQDKEIKIPKSVKKIDSYAFSYCNLTEVEVENGDVSLETDAFNYNPIQHITFKNCSNLDMQLEGYTQDREYAKVILNTPYGSDIQFVKYGQEVQYNSEKYALYENNQLLPFCVITENKVFELRGI